MQRQSSVTIASTEPAQYIVNITFEYKINAEESETTIYENISTPEEFAANYRSMCELTDKLPKDYLRLYQSAPYSISLKGTKNGKPFQKSFADIDFYLQFLKTHKLFAELKRRSTVIF